MTPDFVLNKHKVEYEQWRDRTGAIEKGSRYDTEILVILTRAVKESYNEGTKVKKR